MFKVIKKFAMFASIGTLALAPLALIATPASASPGRVAIGVLSCPRGGQLEHGGNRCGEFSAGVGRSYLATFTPRAGGDVKGVLSCPRGGQLEYGGNQCGEFSAGVGKSYPAAFRFLRYVGHSKAGKR